MLDNPKTLLALIGVTLASSGFLAFQMVSDRSVGISFNPSAQTGALLDKFSDQTAEHVDGSTSVVKSELIRVSDGGSVSPVNGNRNGAVMFYDRASGTVREFYAPDKSTVSLSKSKLPGFINATWSPDRNSAISLFSTKIGPEYRYHNFKTGDNATLPANVRSFAYSPGSDQIVYFATTGDNGGIYLAQANGSNPKKIMETRIPEMELFWPAQNAMYFVAKNLAAGTWDLTKISESGALENILTDLLGLEMTWSRDGTSLLYSHYDRTGRPYLEYLSLGDSSHSSSVSLSLPAVATHCVWSIDSKNIYCGVPSSPLSPEDVLAGKPHPEAVYKLQIGDNTFKELYRGLRNDIDISVQSPFLSPLENYLFFLSPLDNRVYGLEL